MRPCNFDHETIVAIAKTLLQIEGTRKAAVIEADRRARETQSQLWSKVAYLLLYTDEITDTL